MNKVQKVFEPVEAAKFVSSTEVLRFPEIHEATDFSIPPFSVKEV